MIKSSIRSVRRRHYHIAYAVILAMLICIVALYAKSAVRYLDDHYFDQEIRDIVGHYFYDEFWDELPPSSSPLDYSWLDATRRLHVAHAMAGGGTQANTLSALEDAYRRGFHLIEGDYWLSTDGEVFCFHGPDHVSRFTSADIRLKLEMQTGTVCTFDQVANFVSGKEVFLVLDIKTAFKDTGEKILHDAKVRGVEGRLIFQLYHPSDYLAFMEWRKRYNLPGPIITAYRSRRSLRHLSMNALRIGIKAFTFPYTHLHLIASISKDLDLFVHPVNTCEERAAVDGAAQRIGYYTLGKFVSCTNDD